ncbi:MAG: hypothetical protein ACE5ES_01835 [Candidatus Nanoarchaeia archaeon]
MAKNIMGIQSIEQYDSNVDVKLVRNGKTLKGGVSLNSGSILFYPPTNINLKPGEYTYSAWGFDFPKARSEGSFKVEPHVRYELVIDISDAKEPKNIIVESTSEKQKNTTGAVEENETTPKPVPPTSDAILVSYNDTRANFQDMDGFYWYVPEPIITSPKPKTEQKNGFFENLLSFGKEQIGADNTITNTRTQQKSVFDNINTTLGNIGKLSLIAVSGIVLIQIIGLVKNLTD